MQKTRLGISVGLLGAGLYLTGFFGGYVPVILLAGYVLFFEENEWVKRTAVKAVTLMVFFSFLTGVITLIPNAIGCIDSILAIIGISFHISFISNLVGAVTSILDFLEKLLFLGLGFKALNQGTIPVPIVDKMVNKYM